MSKVTNLMVECKNNFAGTYQNTGSTFYQNEQNGIILKVCQRLKPNALKPQFYVMHHSSDGKQSFLTSLYPINENKYRAEIARAYFLVEYDQAEKLEIVQLIVKG